MAQSEISVKLGGDNSKFIAAMAESKHAAEKGFGGMNVAAQDSHEKMVGALGGIKRGLNTLKDVIMLGGFVEGFRRMYQAGVEWAQKAENATDADAQAVLRLKTAVESVSGIVGKAFGFVAGTMEKFGLAVGSMVYGVDAASDALNKMDAEAKKALDAERTKKLTEATKELSKVQRDAAYEAADSNGKVNILLAERLKLTNAMTNVQRDSVEYLKQQTEVAKVDLELAKVTREERAKAAEESKKQGEQRAERQKEIAGSIKEEVELLILQDKVTRGIATGAEADRLKQIQLQRKERAAELELEDLALKAITGQLTPAERERLAELHKQKTALDEQIAAQQSLIAGANAEKQAQAEVTNEYHKQVEEAAKLNAEFDRFRVSLTRIGTDYQSQSTASLQGVRDRLVHQLNATSGNSGMLIKNAEVNTDYGAWLTASTIKSEIAQVEKELSTRAAIQTYASRYGEQAASYKFGDTDTQRALREMNGVQTNMANTLSQISQQLSASGLFPRPAIGPR